MTNLRDTRLGRWVRKHERLHGLVHATWCRVLGPLDTRRVATTSGAVTGSSPPPPQNLTVQLAPLILLQNATGLLTVTGGTPYGKFVVYLLGPGGTAYMLYPGAPEVFDRLGSFSATVDLSNNTPPVGSFTVGVKDETSGTSATGDSVVIIPALPPLP